MLNRILECREDEEGSRSLDKGRARGKTPEVQVAWGIKKLFWIPGKL
jgi:hypothetical protein